MSTIIRTHYDVLGVSPGTPDVVIKAAYRALAKEYHPDGPSASPDSADKFIEIQTAYAVLSKPQARREYDAELQETIAREAPSTRAAWLPTAPWQPVHQARLDIERICARLALYSEPLAQSFHAAYLRGECGEEPERFAMEMESNFFREYFGEDPDMQALARLLLLGGRTGAAYSLNQLMAGGMDAPGKNPQLVLPLLLEQHFEDEALFAEWLKVKFGLMPAGAQPARQEEVLDAESSASPRKDPLPAVARPAASATRPFRFVAQVFMWAVALYFALFAALPLMR